ncbi:OsmC family protein, partial [Methylobacterium sp. WL8]|uniref:OsmC family protein n=1 Tax=Methylobacterium sp. WL8 TaxID=2603899 RepID=UPI001AEE074C
DRSKGSQAAAVVIRSLPAIPQGTGSSPGSAATVLGDAGASREAGVSGIVVTYEGRLRCRSEHAESGAVVLTDAPKDHHGLGAGFSPSEMLAVSLGSCILSMMGVAAHTMGLEIGRATATVTKEMADAPRRIARLSVALQVPGAFDDGQRARLEAAAHACPVHGLLNIDAPITIDWIG